MKQRDARARTYPGRRFFVLFLFVSGMALLGARAVELQIFEHDFLTGQADARHLRVVSKPAVRGVIEDRNGDPVAISAPVDSVWINPKRTGELSNSQYVALAEVLHLDKAKLKKRIDTHRNKEFLYLKRQMSPEDAQRVKKLGIKGVYMDREYRRYYPTSEVFAHLLGFTDVTDGHGIEGLELAFDDVLEGTPGKRRVVKDNLGRVIDQVAIIRPAQPGKNIRLTIDRRIQYLAYRELKLAVQARHAASGSAVVMDPRTGEVLAMVSQPSFNPNNRKGLKGENYRNRAVKDVFEPGSTAKPFTIAAALESGRYRPDTIVDTTPGRFRVTGHDIRDPRSYGPIDLATIISKSSNVGASKVAMSLEPENLWDIFQKVGFGRSTNSGFPGEVDGVLRDFTHWHKLDQATLAFGYGFSVTPLQLAAAYSVIANDGKQEPVKLVMDEAEYDTGWEPERLISPQTAQEVRRMMEQVVAPSGTGYLAAVDGYRVAGKTGTVRKAKAGGYSTDHYLAIFAGMAPARHPRLVTIVMIDDPQGKDYYGGKVAAPVFSRIMTGALRLMNVPPEEWQIRRDTPPPAQHPGGI
ncbi:MAG: peptidoglycan D,D-transpeptidase FtsI family protein [bacterium]